jgi:hypothetical protein
MTVLVIGASSRAIRRLRQIAPSGVEIVDEPLAEPAWILVATTTQRIEAIGSSRLAPYRVIETPEIASDLDAATADALRQALVKMAGIGGPRPRMSSLGLAIARLVIGVRAKPEPSARVDATLAEDPETRNTRSGVPRPMPAGGRLDELLVASERKRAERFVAQVVRSDRRS